MKFKILILILIFISTQIVKSQDIEYARKIISELSDIKYLGRAYETDGNKKAAYFIKNQLEQFKTNHFGNNYFQTFYVTGNCLYGDMFFVSGNDTLIPAQDFIVNGNTKSLNGKFEIIKFDTSVFKNPETFNKKLNSDFNKKFIFIDTIGLKSDQFGKNYNRLIYKSNSAEGIIFITTGNLTFVPSQNQTNFSEIKVLKKSAHKIGNSAFIKIDSEYKQRIKTQNIAAYIKGRKDTFIVYTAHYDHIGTMGKNVYFPGANDNASGTAMVLNLAKYFSEIPEKPEYSVAFILFSAEEIGLTGSKFYTENPLFPLSKIKYLINLDMVGSGDKGIQIVNSTVFKPEFSILNEINNKKNYLPQIKPRGEAANSDHYFFYTNGVKAFFIYTLGDYKEYHNINDKPENLPLTAYNNLFKLIIDFHQYNNIKK